MVGNRIARVTVYCNNSAKKGDHDTIIPNKKMIAEYEITTLYPNPTTGKFTMEFNIALKDAEFLIYNSAGTLIASHKESGDKIPFDISIFAAGTYHVVVFHDHKSKAAVLIKE